MKLRYSIAVLLALVVGAQAAADRVARQKIKAIRTGTDTTDQIVDLRVQDDATVGDDLLVIGTATLTEAPKVVAVTASGSATPVTTNAPACTEETPIWVTVTYGTDSYVFPAWLLD